VFAVTPPLSRFKIESAVLGRKEKNMNKVLLVRHCQSYHHVDRTAGPNSHLTDLGREQSMAVADRLQKELVGQRCRLISSDLHRTWETAAVLADRLGVECVPASALREWRGRTVEQMTPEEKQRMLSDRRWFLFDWPLGPGVESWRQFYQRVADFMTAMSKAIPDDELAIVVAHGGTISNIVAWWLEIPVDALPARTPFAGTTASISMLARNQFGEPYIERLNDRIHLDGVGTSPTQP